MQKHYVCDGILIGSNEEITKEEQKAYVEYVENHWKKTAHEIKSIELGFDGNDVFVRPTFLAQRFNRIRRITGYLVGDVRRFNDGKAAEVKDRVKHNV